MRRKFSKVYDELLESRGPIAVFEEMHNKKVDLMSVHVFGWENEGKSSYDHDLVTSVSKYLFEDLEITEAFISKDLDNRPGIIKESTKYITVHDTAGAREGSGAVAHMKYVTNGGGGTSWHYSLGNDGIFHHIPNNEVAYHAGDGSRTYSLENTNVKATNRDPEVAISLDGYYTLNNIKSTIIAPTKDEKILSKEYLNDMSIEIQIGEDGNYHMGVTWYSKSYNLIANGGGNRNSIGIESCIDYGSDLYLTWQKLAKLVAFLLEEQNLNLDAVVQHHFFSGKDCPMTMRHANMWDHFLDLVDAEYFVRTKMKDYKISISPKSNNLKDNGRVILPVKGELEYSLNIIDPSGNTHTKELNSKA